MSFASCAVPLALLTTQLTKTQQHLSNLILLQSGMTVPVPAVQTKLSDTAFSVLLPSPTPPPPETAPPSPHEEVRICRSNLGSSVPSPAL
jgi:hypothetical protein